MFTAITANSYFIAAGCMTCEDGAGSVMVFNFRTGEQIAYRTGGTYAGRKVQMKKDVGNSWSVYYQSQNDDSSTESYMH